MREPPDERCRLLPVCSSWFGCGAGSRAASWCPTSRQTIQADGTDYLGVWVSARHPILTGFFGSVLTMTHHAVMRLEPTEVEVANAGWRDKRGYILVITALSIAVVIVSAAMALDVGG